MQATHLLVEDVRLLAAQSAATILARPSRDGPAFGGHAVEPDLGVRIVKRGALAAPDDFFLRHCQPHSGRTIRLKPDTGLDPKRLKFLHRFTPRI
jgi:hypothetical protein